MALQLSTDVRNAMLDAIETFIGTSATLVIYSGAAPANCAAEATGTVLATITLPSNFMADAASGAKALAGTWEDLSADASGTAGYFRVIKSAAAQIQGTVTGSGGGGDMIVTSTAFTIGQKFSVTQFTLTAANA